MPSPEEKQRRKDVQNSLIAQRKEQLAVLPMPEEKLGAYFEYLDQHLTAEGCDHILRFTQQFANDHSLTFDSVKRWLSNYGGYCDCEALANVEDHFEGLQLTAKCVEL